MICSGISQFETQIIFECIQIRKRNFQLAQVHLRNPDAFSQNELLLRVHFASKKLLKQLHQQQLLIQRGNKLL